MNENTPTIEDRLSRIETAMQSFIQNTNDVKASTMSVLAQVNRVIELADEKLLDKKIQQFEAQVGRIYDHITRVDKRLMHLETDVADLMDEEEIEP